MQLSIESDVKKEIKQDRDVQLALEQAATNEAPAKPPVETRHKFWLAGYALLFVALGVLFRLLAFDFFGLIARFIPLLQKLTLGSLAIIAILALSKVIKVYLIARMANRAAQYNLYRVLDLVTALTVALITISLVFADWYTA